MSVIVGQAYDHLLKKQISQNPDMGGWSFLQSLCEAKGIVRNREDESKKPPYVHPVVSAPKMSLEMCTESLGTESGNETGDEISLLAMEATNVPMIPKPREETYSTVRENSFPPPLKSSKGFNHSRMVKSYTEDGRLVVQAIRVCSPPSCFVSERCEGRLRLCFSKSTSSLSHDGDEEFEENESELEARDEGEDEENGQEEDAEEEMKGKIGNNEFRRLRRRCNENGCQPTTMHDWKQQQQQHFWVAT